MNVDEMVEQIAKDFEPMSEEEFSEIRRKTEMKAIIITCKTVDWLNYRSDNIRSTETDLSHIKIYDGVLNVCWKWLSCPKKLEDYFMSKDCIISYVYASGNIEKRKFNNYTQLMKYSPLVNADGLLFTEEEVC